MRLRSYHLTFCFIVSVTSFQSSLITNKKPILHFRRHHDVLFSPSSSHLNSFNADTLETFSAATAVVCSSLLGMNLNKLGKLEGVGQIVAIITASHFSSLGISPTSHRFYDICWKWCLPASLSLLLLSPIVEEKDTVYNGERETSRRETARSKARRSSVRDSARREIIAVSVPFFIGCIGSILGCLLSYVFCWLGRNNQVRVHKHILRGRQHYLFQPGKLLYEPSEAAVAAGCLISSYIGGSLNYLASAKIIAGAEGRPKAAATGVLSGTFGSVASDMLVMPMYLSTLASITSSKRFRKWFPGRSKSNKSAAKVRRSESGKGGMEQADFEKKQSIRGSHILLATFMLPLVGAIVAISDAFEARLQVHGLCLLCICLLSSVTHLLFARFPRMLSDIGQVTLTLSDACYFVLISVIGTSIDLRYLAREGVWSSASSVIFSSVPLLVHFIVITTGSVAMMKLFPRFESFPLSVEEVVVASNTAICGPATAAAMVAKMMASGRNKGSNRMEWKGLALAGTFWGIVGYAFATYIGVAVSRALLTTIL